MSAQPDPNAAHWSADLVAEATSGRDNGRVGSRLVNETDEYRIWLIDIQPGARLPFHTHVLNYFWVATSQGRARSRNADGRVVEMDYSPGDTRHMHFGLGEFMTHDLENIGNTVLSFTTVEDKRSPNRPLPLD
jgi:quercetin dioxygenase-like cupin family protein